MVEKFSELLKKSNLLCLLNPDLMQTKILYVQVDFWPNLILALLLKIEFNHFVTVIKIETF